MIKDDVYDIVAHVMFNVPYSYSYSHSCYVMVHIYMASIFDAMYVCYVCYVCMYAMYAMHVCMYAMYAMYVCYVCMICYAMYVCVFVWYISFSFGVMFTIINIAAE